MKKNFPVSAILAGILITASCSKEATTAPNQINTSDTTKTAIIRISSLLPNPKGEDDYHESFTLKNSGTADGSLDGWQIQDNENVTWKLAGVLKAGESVIVESDKTAQLLNSGDTVRLQDDKGVIVQTISYTDAKDGQEIIP